jgi:hypothetical protein
MPLILPFYALSGFVSLGYQVAWFRYFTDWFGSTNLTFALVVCSFIGGLGTDSSLREEYSGLPILSDQHNDLDQMYLSPGNLSRIRYNPAEVLDFLTARGLADRAQIRTSLQNLGRLR